MTPSLLVIGILPGCKQEDDSQSFRGYADRLRHETWWDRKRSWALGPVYRYVMALYRCYGHYEAPANSLLPTWSWLSRPRFLPLAIAVFAGMVALVAIAMIAISIANLRRGLVQVEIECAV